MRTLEVTREFRDKAKQLADQARVPQVRTRLRLLADHYQREINVLERVRSPTIAPTTVNGSRELG